MEKLLSETKAEKQAHHENRRLELKSQVDFNTIDRQKHYCEHSHDNSKRVRTFCCY